MWSGNPRGAGNQQGPEGAGVVVSRLPNKGADHHPHNEAALALLKDRKEGTRVKHIDVIHHFARERVASGEIKFVYCRSADNTSDCFTKALPRKAFDVCLVGIGMLIVDRSG